ncbi:nicotinate (nicotinamide) nucleotide adenylyltransferase [Hymenobacter sp. BT770]|uniref:nicotinate (nicotinamide) nucleotide adenylyltransferase n=1 Tax=Hymenobacter sp. BT770 TaxID=2886942 RepID=UPI001D1148C8|nr:nicotinate (nicotinamide) nucleotide adenylyltransferase [Hymenobacter sp. BT770]MCC3154349.1 nicotinate-nucleotide adenylyltransferase [Hymenobacter sp. BT770]MDO3415670.1 nicotinate (nicotinamide) nucleotide adenylyltransferase [Hymenobacter sp. BT770]
MSGRARIGLLFGSFNPVHVGHLILAEYFATRTDLAEVWLVVSPHSPFKEVADLLPDTERLRLVELALAGNPHLRAEDIEFSLPRPSYTIATLDALRRRHPALEFVLLMGADNLPGLPRWQESARLLSEVDIYIYPRPNVELPELTPFPRVQVMAAPLLDISATYIRESLRAGHSIRYLVPAAVEAALLALQPSV